MEEKKFVGKTHPHAYAYVQWTTKPDEQAKGDHKVILCVHGLSRSSRDFDYLAKKLIEEGEKKHQKTTVVSLDVVGRGKSDWLKDYKMYNYTTYGADVKEFIEFLCEEHKVSTIDYIGTSMGGIIAMVVFALGIGSKVSRVVINDVGAVLPLSALDRIKRVVGGSISASTPRFGSVSEAAEYFRTVAKGFGTLSDAQWLAMASYSVVKTEEGNYRLHYDPAIFSAFEVPQKDVELWQIYNSITAPTLLLHGVNSDLLSNEIIEQMEKQGPGEKKLLKVVHFDGCGHAPALLVDEQCDVVVNFIFNN